MAKFEEVLELVRAGYSKEEVTQLLSSEAVNTEIPAQPDTDAAPEPDPDPEPDKTEQTRTDDRIPSDSQYNELLGAIEKLTNTIITRNVNMSNIDVTPARTTDDMIASVLGLNTEKPGGKRK